MKSLPATSKIKIAERMSPRPSSEELVCFREMHIDAASIWTTIEDANYDYMVETRHLLEQHGILLWNIGILDLHCDPTMVLGLPGFDEKIAQYKDYLRDLGRAGIGYTTYAHMANIKLLPYYQTSSARHAASQPANSTLNSPKTCPFPTTDFTTKTRSGRHWPGLFAKSFRSPRMQGSALACTQTTRLCPT